MNGTSSACPPGHGGADAAAGRTTSARPLAAAFARRAGALRRAPLALLGLLALSCKGSVQADARVSSEASSGELRSFDRPLESPPNAPAPAANDLGPGDYALLGARHDLAYAGPKSPTCACLAVALRDQPEDGAFQWTIEPPRLEPSTQWIIALSSKDVPCDAPPGGTLGASYQGYGTEGNDVVVYVEALGEGRPMTSGAIIPRPKPSGAVFVEPTNAVYGKPLDGKSKRCKLPAPGGAAP